MKKIIYLITATILVANLSGCASKNTTTNTDNKDSTMETTEPVTSPIIEIEKNALIDNARQLLGETTESMFFYDFNMDKVPELCLLNNEDISLYVYNSENKEYEYKHNICIFSEITTYTNEDYQSYLMLKSITTSDKDYVTGETFSETAEFKQLYAMNPADFGYTYIGCTYVIGKDSPETRYYNSENTSISQEEFANNQSEIFSDYEIQSEDIIIYTENVDDTTLERAYNTYMGETDIDAPTDETTVAPTEPPTEELTEPPTEELTEVPTETDPEAPTNPPTEVPTEPVKKWQVPQGTKFIIGATGQIINEGEYITGEIMYNDILQTKDYNYSLFGDGWRVKALENKESYEPIFDEIFGIPVWDMEYAFEGCTNMVVAPEIPDSIGGVYGAFKDCKNLKKTPYLSDEVVEMTYTFYGCEKLEIVENLPPNLTSMVCTFSNCSSLKMVPDIPDSVTLMTETFISCTSLIKSPKLPAELNRMFATFAHCSSLLEPPEIPSKVTYMEQAFLGCTSLKYASAFPSGVENILFAYLGCESLTTAADIPNGITDITSLYCNCLNLTVMPNIPNSVTNMENAFSGTAIKEVPQLPDGVTNLKHTFSGCHNLVSLTNLPANVTNMYGTFFACYALKEVPAIPASVNNMIYTFVGCNALTGELTINCNPSVYTDCFKEVNFANLNLTLKGSSTILDKIGNTGSNYGKQFKLYN